MNKKKLLSAMLAATMAFSLSGCGTKGEKENNNVPEKTKYESENLLDDLQVVVDPPKKIDSDVNASAIDFSINLFKSSVLDTVNNGGNAMVSPESVLFALGMTANGASGETLKEMENVLCPGYDISKINDYCYAILDKRRASEKAKIKVANSIWLNNSLSDVIVSEDFLKTDKTYYDADVFKSSFDDNTLKDINSWVNDNTDGMIKDIMNRISVDDVMYLINAVAFDAKWETAYKEDGESVKDDIDFTNFDQSVAKVTMLYSTESGFMSNENCKAFVKPYEGGQYGFMGILPNEGIELNDFISGMNKDWFLELYNSMDSEYEVYTGIPEFTSDYSMSMSDVMKTMGMEQAFDPDNADFSNMIKSSDDNVFIDDVLHKTHIEVDSNGTKAAAATVVVMDKGIGPVRGKIESIVLDRPFVYAIVDIETGMPLFIGAINSL